MGVWLIDVLKRTWLLVQVVTSLVWGFPPFALNTRVTENTVSIFADVTAYAELCLPSCYLETGCITPLFHRCSGRTT
jgi:hypothetical protein